MVLSPLDIHNIEFGTKMRGYNVDGSMISWIKSSRITNHVESQQGIRGTIRCSEREAQVL